MCYQTCVKSNLQQLDMKPKHKKYFNYVTIFLMNHFKLVLNAQRAKMFICKIKEKKTILCRIN